MASGTTDTEQTLDLNNLFNLSYNFDLLKKVIENLLVGNKSMNQKVNDITTKLEKKDEMISKQALNLINKIRLEDKVNILTNEQFHSNTNDDGNTQNIVTIYSLTIHFYFYLILNM